MVNIKSLKRHSRPAAAMLAGLALSANQPATVALLPMQMQRPVARSASNESFLPSANQLDPFLSLQFGTSLEGLSQTQGLDSAVATFVNGTVLGFENSFGPGGGVTSSAPTTNPGAGVQTACKELAGQLQSAGKYWNGQTISGMPGLPGANSMAVSAGGKSSNLSPQGRAGAWCRPASIPFTESSPLASRAFWQPIVVLSFGIIVFWLSRGIRLPS